MDSHIYAEQWVCIAQISVNEGPQASLVSCLLNPQDFFVSSRNNPWKIQGQGELGPNWKQSPTEEDHYILLN